MSARRTCTGLACLGLALTLSACGDPGTQEGPVPGGDPAAGREAALQHGCASCHTIPGVQSVNRTIGPDLTGFEDQLYIAGQLPNRPEELIRWIQNPQEIVPSSAMPNMGITEQDARDIAAFLYDR